MDLLAACSRSTQMAEILRKVMSRSFIASFTYAAPCCLTAAVFINIDEVLFMNCFCRMQRGKKPSHILIVIIRAFCKLCAQKSFSYSKGVEYSGVYIFSICRHKCCSFLVHDVPDLTDVVIRPSQSARNECLHFVLPGSNIHLFHIRSAEDDCSRLCFCLILQLGTMFKKKPLWWGFFLHLWILLYSTLLLN